MQIRPLSLGLLAVLACCPLICLSLEQGFVYCPAYPCACESDKGALVVNCQYLYLTALPKFLAFDGRIRTLSLRQNSIRQLPARAFHGLHVENIDLTENVISQVHEDAFEGLENVLEELHLQVYAMNGMPSAAIRRLKRLKVLRIIGCKADTLNTTALDGLTSLVELHLQACRIKDIDTGGLSSLKQLQVLNLDKNSLQTEHLPQMGKLYQLRKLVLSRNAITKLTDHVFHHLQYLSHLDLSNNKITHIDVNALKPLHYSLETLKLEDNHLTEEVFKSLHSLRNLRHLIVRNNNITALPVGAFRNHEFLAHLELSDNNIVDVNKQALKGTEKYLQILGLKNNPITMIHNNTFRDHTRLQQLYLDNVRLGGTLHDGVFHGIQNTLHKLSISGANVTSLDLLALSQMTALEDLDLSKNTITEIPVGVFHRLHKLVKLDLSHNEINDLAEAAFWGLQTSLESIDLRHNALETISSCVFEGFQHLEEFRLQANPLACDCRLIWLHNWLQMRVPDYSRSLLEWRCAAPPGLVHRQFTSLFLADLQCPNNNTFVLPNCSFNDSSSDFYVFEEIPAFGNSEPSPLLPLDMMGTSLDVEVLPKGRGTLLAIWNANSTVTITGYRVVLRRSNDSLEEADMTFAGTVTRYLFTGLLDYFMYETCVTVLGDGEMPMGRDCVETITEQGVPPVTKEVGRETKTNSLTISFTTLIWSYITGCIIASTFCAILAVILRRRQRVKKCPAGFNPGYSAWTGTRYSVPSPSPTTSTCYFATPSVSSCDEDGLVVTISGIDDKHSVVDRVGDAEPENDASGAGHNSVGGHEKGVMGKGEGSGSVNVGTVTGGSQSGVLGERGFQCGGGQSSFSYTGHCSTGLDSFRRQLPAHYVINNTDIMGEDYFFHF